MGIDYDKLAQFYAQHKQAQRFKALSRPNKGTHIMTCLGCGESVEVHDNTRFCWDCKRKQQRHGAMAG